MTSDDAEYADAVHQRHLLVEALAEIDDVFAERYLEAEDGVEINDINMAIRRNTIKSKVVPVLMGSSFKNKVIILYEAYIFIT